MLAGKQLGIKKFQLHHAVDNMYKTIRFILEFSAEHRDYNNTLYYNLII